MSDPRREDDDEHVYVHVHEDVHGGPPQARPVEDTPSRGAADPGAVDGPRPSACGSAAALDHQHVAYRTHELALRECLAQDVTRRTRARRQGTRLEVAGGPYDTDVLGRGLQTADEVFVFAERGELDDRHVD